MLFAYTCIFYVSFFPQNVLIVNSVLDVYWMQNCPYIFVYGVFVNSIHNDISMSYSFINPQMITIWATTLDNSMPHSLGNYQWKQHDLLYWKAELSIYFCLCSKLFTSMKKKVFSSIHEFQIVSSIQKGKCYLHSIYI
jgi:hypothetical protein